MGREVLRQRNAAAIDRAAGRKTVPPEQANRPLRGVRKKTHQDGRARAPAEDHSPTKMKRKEWTMKNENDLNKPATRRVIRAALAGSLLSMPLTAATSAPVYEQSDNLLLRSAGVILIIAMIWIVLYKAVYPFFLRYYRDEFCKTIFWNLFMLYTATWIFVSMYVLLDVGFYYGWLPWTALFLCVWCLISGAVLLLRRVPA